MVEIRFRHRFSNKLVYAVELPFDLGGRRLIQRRRESPGDQAMQAKPWRGVSG